MVDFVGVLAGGVLAAQEGVVCVGFVLLHLDALSTTRLVFTGLGYRIQLGYLVLKNGKEQCKLCCPFNTAIKCILE